MRRPRSRSAFAIAAVVVAVALAGCGDDAAESSDGFEEIAGQWSGTLRQADIDPFPIDVTIESAEHEKLNVVHYGGEIDCSGTWDFLREARGEFRFREVIRSGRGGRCKGAGTVRLTPGSDPDRLGYVFRGGGVQSEGELSREG